jgi:hypothetical protein
MCSYKEHDVDRYKKEPTQDRLGEMDRKPSMEKKYLAECPECFCQVSVRIDNTKKGAILKKGTKKFYEMQHVEERK